MSIIAETHATIFLKNVLNATTISRSLVKGVSSVWGFCYYAKNTT